MQTRLSLETGKRPRILWIPNCLVLMQSLSTLPWVHKRRDLGGDEQNPRPCHVRCVGQRTWTAHFAEGWPIFLRSSEQNGAGTGNKVLAPAQWWSWLRWWSPAKGVYQLQPGRRPINSCFLVSTKNGKWGTPDLPLLQAWGYRIKPRNPGNLRLSLPFRSIAVPK